MFLLFFDQEKETVDIGNFVLLCASCTNRIDIYTASCFQLLKMYSFFFDIYVLKLWKTFFSRFNKNQISKNM